MWACSTAWLSSLARSPSALPDFQLKGVAPPSNSIYATMPWRDLAQLPTAQAALAKGCSTCRIAISMTMAPNAKGR